MTVFFCGAGRRSSSFQNMCNTNELFMLSTSVLVQFQQPPLKGAYYEEYSKHGY